VTSNPDFQTRYVKHAGELPQVGRLARIPLLMTGSEFDERDLRKAGALRGKLGWSIARDGSVAKIVKLEHAWRRLDGRNDDGFQVAPFPG